MAELSKSRSGESAPQRSTRELLKDAQQEQQTTIIQQRIALLDAMEELQEIGGRDDVQQSLLEIVKSRPGGILLPFVQQVIPDAGELMKARRALEKAGLMKQTKAGQTWRLEAVED